MTTLIVMTIRTIPTFMTHRTAVPVIKIRVMEKIIGLPKIIIQHYNHSVIIHFNLCPDV